MRNSYDIIGDVHGCAEELQSLLHLLGYEFVSAHGATHPEGRTAIFLGDLVNRGPDTPGVLRLVMNMMESGSALCVLGNHDEKLLQCLKGEPDSEEERTASLTQLREQSNEFCERVVRFLEELPAQVILDSENLVVAHAGLKESMHGMDTPEARQFAVNGETTGKLDEHGKPIRHNWAADYHGKPFVIYGHTPVREPAWLNRTMNIDTGCVYGGKLTALRYPEMTLVAVPAALTYHKRKKPIV